MKKIDISVVIPTYKRPQMIIRCLNSLLKQDFDRSYFEIIVVDDGSGDDTGDRIGAWKQKNEGINLSYISQKNAGPASARNRGIEEASAEIVAFTDDDCEVDPNWISVILKYLNNYPGKLGVGGVTYTDIAQVTPLTSQISNSIETDFPTCNVAYRASTLEEIGGFDESYPVTNEDIDITWRILEKGEIGHEETMRVKHPPRKDSFIKTMKGVRNLEGEFILWERLPKRYKKEHIHPLYFLFFHYTLKLPIKRLARATPYLVKNPFVNLWLLVILFSERVYLLYLLPGFIYQSYLRRHKKK